jgi:uncharacterized membrane protein YbaN (DUF454 family)
MVKRYREGNKMGMIEKIKAVLLILSVVGMWVSLGFSQYITMIVVSVIVGGIGVIEFFTS